MIDRLGLITVDPSIIISKSHRNLPWWHTAQKMRFAGKIITVFSLILAGFFMIGIAGFYPWQATAGLGIGAVISLIASTVLLKKSYWEEKRQEIISQEQREGKSDAVKKLISVFNRKTFFSHIEKEKWSHAVSKECKEVITLGDITMEDLWKAYNAYKASEACESQYLANWDQFLGDLEMTQMFAEWDRYVADTPITIDIEDESEDESEIDLIFSTNSPFMELD